MVHCEESGVCGRVELPRGCQIRKLITPELVMATWRAQSIQKPVRIYRRGRITPRYPEATLEHESMIERGFRSTVGAAPEQH
jgi:hypothetical protein